MDEYRITKQQVAVTLTMLDGDELSGHIFVQPVGYARSEDPRDMVNAADPFFPLATPDGEVLLIAKDSVVEVIPEVAADEDELRLAATPTAQVQLTLVGGGVRNGNMHLEVRADRPRLLDYLNQCTDHFLSLHTTHGVRLINRRMILHVRPLD